MDEVEIYDHELGEYHHERYTPEERKFLKTILVFLGHPLDFSTDRWDKETDQAVRSFQRANGLTTDGIIGPKTLRVMANSVDKLNSLNKQQKSKFNQFLLIMASREEISISTSRQGIIPFPSYFGSRYYTHKLGNRNR